ncbi:MAG: hypothetical protein WHS89_13000 [Acidimicrobiales bacterium]
MEETEPATGALGAEELEELESGAEPETGWEDEPAVAPTIASAGAATVTSPPPTRAAPAGPTRGRSNKGLLVGAGAAVVALLVVGGIALASGGGGGGGKDTTEAASSEQAPTTTTVESTTTTVQESTTTSSVESTTSTASTVSSTTSTTAAPVATQPPAFISGPAPTSPGPSGPPLLVFTPSAARCELPKGGTAVIGTMSNVGGSAGSYTASSPIYTVPRGTLSAGASIPVTATAPPTWESSAPIFFSGPGLNTSINCSINVHL